MWQGRRETERGREDWERANRDKIGDRKKDKTKKLTLKMCRTE